ncbi:MAG: GH36-type glycosyl hydrolase domain-containing protein, partial [Methylocella sp.]
YRRGFFDDGSPLGSAANSECRIDTIAQSWAVLSGAGKPERAAQALAEAHRQLVRPADGLALLFTPPFDKSFPDPGYIRAYPPGIRENGGQYSHGVIWEIFAHAQLGEAEKAFQLFSLLDPVNHARSEAETWRYKVEPYVIVADVYSVAPHTGQGGWTWYTGSASWMYRAGLEAILGIVREGNMLRVKPCMPPEWNEFQVSLKYGATRHEITVRRGSGAATSSPQVQKISRSEYLIALQDKGGVVDIELALEDRLKKLNVKEDRGNEAVA